VRTKQYIRPIFTNTLLETITIFRGAYYFRRISDRLLIPTRFNFVKNATADFKSRHWHRQCSYHHRTFHVPMSPAVSEKFLGPIKFPYRMIFELTAQTENFQGEASCSISSAWSFWRKTVWKNLLPAATRTKKQRVIGFTLPSATLTDMNMPGHL